MFAKYFSKEKLREMILGRLRKWQIDQFLSHAAEEGPKKSVVSAHIRRTRLDPGNTNHFVTFIASANFK